MSIPENVFSSIKNKRNKNIGESQLRESTSLKFTKQGRPRILDNQFSSIFSVDDKTSPNVQGPQGDTMHEININKEGITRESPCKAGGPDTTSAIFLKETADEVAVRLTLIFQASLHQANIPDKWRKEIRTPIFKSRNKALKNYRPITLTSITCKVLQHIIHRNIISHLDQQRIWRCSTCKSRSCEIQLIKTVNNLAKSLNEGQQVDSILLDFSNAFDVVYHRKVLLKLHRYGIRGENLKWILEKPNPASSC